MQSFIDHALSKCPFLAAVREACGEDAARAVAAKPFNKPSSQGPILEESYDFAATFSAYHGPQGSVPLSLDGSRSGGRYPYRADVRPVECETVQCLPESSQAVSDEKQPEGQSPDKALARLRAAPFATISLSTSFLGDGWPWARARKQKRHRHEPQDQGRAQQPSQSQPQFNAMQHVLQPLTAMVITKQGHLVCPPPIVWMRTTLAKSALCRTLRPMDVEFKLAACGVLSALANLPPGMVKEHFEKFSPGWFVAVHITIPFVAALRKAVVMPKYALVVTIAGAIAGQIIGGRIERLRLQHREEQARALRDGERLPDDVPLYCAAMKAIIDPWGDTV